MNFEKLNEVSCRLDDIQNGDEIPIGGSFQGKNDLRVVADIDNFESFFQTVEKNALNFEKSEEMKTWLNQIAPGFDPKIFAHMFAFDNVLRIKYPNLTSNVSKRIMFYNPEEKKTLTQAVDEGVCQCAEIAILAQAYFQRQGVKTRYFGGELLHSSEEEFGEAHSFLELKTDKEDYFYDPANPIWDKGRYMPRVSSIEATSAQKQKFEKKIHTPKGRNCAFLEAKNILVPSPVWYYGCGDGCNIFPSFIISKNNVSLSSQNERDI